MVKELNFSNRLELQDYIEHEKAEMYEMIVQSIDQAYAMGAIEAPVVVFYIEEEDVYIDMISYRSDWQESLTLALNYYVTVEEYEKCARLKKLIEKL